MKPSLRLSLVILLLIASFGGRAVGKDLVSPDMERILKRGKLILTWLNLYLKTDKSGTTIDAILDRYPRK